MPGPRHRHPAPRLGNGRGGRDRADPLPGGLPVGAVHGTERSGRPQPPARHRTAHVPPRAHRHGDGRVERCGIACLQPRTEAIPPWPGAGTARERAGARRGPAHLCRLEALSRRAIATAGGPNRHNGGARGSGSANRPLPLEARASAMRRAPGQRGPRAGLRPTATLSAMRDTVQFRPNGMGLGDPEIRPPTGRRRGSSADRSKVRTGQPVVCRLRFQGLLTFIVQIPLASVDGLGEVMWIGKGMSRAEAAPPSNLIESEATFSEAARADLETARRLLRDSSARSSTGSTTASS